MDQFPMKNPENKPHFYTEEKDWLIFKGWEIGFEILAQKMLWVQNWL